MKTPSAIVTDLTLLPSDKTHLAFDDLCRRAIEAGPLSASQMGPGVKKSQLVLKRGCDILCSLSGLVLLLPVLALVALAVKVTSPGPVLFRQKRVGREGRIFTMLKFRTMQRHASRQVDTDGRTLVDEKDDRLTSIGGFLRHGLDELPQLINVLRGEMSLVGPRPDEPYHLLYYEEGWDHRLTVRPGITGLPQVAGRRALPWADRVALDNAYISCLSLSLDVRIALRTLTAIWTNEGNA